MWCRSVLGGFHTRTGVLAFILTCCAYCLGFLMAFCVARSVDISVSFTYFCVAMVSISLAQLLPISIGGFGTREAAAIGLLGGNGNTREQVLAFSFLYFAVMYIWGGGCGFLAYLSMVRKRSRGD